MRLKTEENGRVAYLCGAPQIGKIISEEVEETSSQREILPA